MARKPGPFIQYALICLSLMVDIEDDDQPEEVSDSFGSSHPTSTSRRSIAGAFQLRAPRCGRT